MQTKLQRSKSQTSRRITLHFGGGNVVLGVTVLFQQPADLSTHPFMNVLSRISSPLIFLCIDIEAWVHE